MKSPVFCFFAALILLTAASIFSMEEKQKKPVVSSEIVFLKWLEKKMRAETTPETLTSEGLAYILYCFPKDMQYEIARHVPIPERDAFVLIENSIELKEIHQHMMPQMDYRSISRVEWCNATRVLQVQVTLNRISGKVSSFHTGPRALNDTDERIIINPPCDHDDTDWDIAYHIKGTDLERYLHIGNTLTILSSRIRAPSFLSRECMFHAEPVPPSILFCVYEIDLSPLYAFMNYMQNTPRSQQLYLKEKLYLHANRYYRDYRLGCPISSLREKLRTLATSFLAERATVAAAAAQSSLSSGNGHD